MVCIKRPFVEQAESGSTDAFVQQNVFRSSDPGRLDREVRADTETSVKLTHVFAPYDVRKGYVVI